MTESREDRLSRIRAAVDDVRAIPPTDAAWLLDQIPADYEYRVEGWTQIDGDEGPYMWVQWDGPYGDQETAEQVAADRTAYTESTQSGPARKWRVSRSPAPAWVPVEDEEG